MNALFRESADTPELPDEEEIGGITRQQAIVIGIDAYGEGFNTLHNAVNDAQAVAALLQDDYGFELLPPAQAPLLNHAATWEQITHMVTTSLEQGDEPTRWLFYFAGHGLIVDGQGYLLPAAAVKGEPGGYLSLRWLTEACINSACAETLIILDACYSGQALVQPADLSDDRISNAGSSRLVRQIITSGNPSQPVLDGGGSDHSIFTQSLLDALEGWAGIHEPADNVRHKPAGDVVRFNRLLDHLGFEIPARLRTLNQSSFQQRPIGGYLTGNANQGEFVFQSRVPRLPPQIVQAARSDDPTARQNSLSRLLAASEAEPTLRPIAVELGRRLLQRQASHKDAPLITGTLRYEPVVAVRVQAATMLGQLGDPAAIDPLIAALDDVPEVCAAAARALGQLGAARAAPPLLNKLPTAGEALFLDLVGAVGALDDAPAVLEALRHSLQRGLLVPFIGPDFPQELTGVPSRADIVRRMVEHERFPTTESLADVANATIPGQKRREYTCPACGAMQYQSGNRYSFTSLMRNQLDIPYGQSGPIYQSLANLKIPFWISGTYDDLLKRSLNAEEIFKGTDTQYTLAERPTIVRLVGDISRPDSLRVLEVDYEEPLRIDRLLTLYLKEMLYNKSVLFLGYDLHSPDFALQVKHILNRHLAEAKVRAFIVWDQPGPIHHWADQPIHPIVQDSFTFVRTLAQLNP